MELVPSSIAIGSCSFAASRVHRSTSSSTIQLPASPSPQPGARSLSVSLHSVTHLTPGHLTSICPTVHRPCTVHTTHSAPSSVQACPPRHCRPVVSAEIKCAGRVMLSSAGTHRHQGAALPPISRRSPADLPCAAPQNRFRANGAGGSDSEALLILEQGKHVGADDLGSTSGRIGGA